VEHPVPMAAAIEVLLVTSVTNAKTEAANTSIKNIKRTARGLNQHRPPCSTAHSLFAEAPA